MEIGMSIFFIDPKKSRNGTNPKKNKGKVGSISKHLEAEMELTVYSIAIYAKISVRKWSQMVAKNSDRFDREKKSNRF